MEKIERRVGPSKPFRFLMQKDNRTYKVYVIINKEGVPKYTGVTGLCLIKRLDDHLRNFKKFAKNEESRPYYNFFGDVCKGLDHAIIGSVAEYDNPFDASAHEQKLLKEYKTLVNQSCLKYATDSDSEWFFWMRKRGGNELINKYRNQVVQKFA